MIRWINASVSGSTELVASSSTRILHPRTRARISDTIRQHFSLVYRDQPGRPHSHSCFSPAEKFAPSGETRPSSLNFSRVPILADESVWTSASASLSSASDLMPSGSILSLASARLAYVTYRTVPPKRKGSCGMMAILLRSCLSAICTHHLTQSSPYADPSTEGRLRPH
jgi:hypothetical protein